MEEKIMQIESVIAGDKQLLAATDYEALKYAEGFISEEDYAEIKAYRQGLRDEINEMEAEEIQVMSENKDK